MSIKFEKSFAGIRLGSGKVEVSRFVNAVTFAYAERKIIRELEEKGLRVFVPSKKRAPW